MTSIRLPGHLGINAKVADRTAAGRVLRLENR